MLGHTYRYQVYNSTGVSVTVVVKSRRWKFASDGSRTDDSESTPIASVSVAAGAYSNGSTIDNSADKYLGAHLVASFTPSASATGLVRVVRQMSTDGGTTWPSNGNGEHICAVSFAASSTAQIAQGEAG
ncbi:MAG: hypothetical protein LCI02_05045 [Proteobacteria bacterium]|nr:hypothetical protein [Pseudomonadota bacterium]